MHRQSAARVLVALALAPALLAGCTGPAVPHPITAESRYLCCNVWYERPKIADVFFQWGTKIPLGTPVRVTEVRTNQVKFQPDGHPEITLVLKYGRRQVAMDTLLEQLFVRDDPRRRLRSLSSKTRRAIEDGAVAPGMTREQVLMAVGYPPAHRTPSLEASDWHYWENRWHQWIVRFEGARVSAVTR